MVPRTALVVHRGAEEPPSSIQELPLVNYSKAPSQPVLLNHERVDYGPLRGWCEAIERFRDYPMDELQQLKSGGPDVLPVRVIDCHEHEIVSVQEPLDYFALSYVWGPASVAAQDPAPPGKSLPEHLPATVEDAMTVVKQLGYRYLWVDRYCLDQSDTAEFQAQLNQMADIYRHALATIIAAAGDSADYGLPGVSIRARARQPRIRIGAYTLWSSMTDPRKVVRETKWMTRAWTYQEGVFSANWIAFTDEQVFFQRSNRELANQERWWKVSCEMFPQGGLGAAVNCPLLAMFDNVWNNAGDIHRQLMRYTARDLTYQSDSIKGMLGLVKRCGVGPYPINHYLGVPVLGPLINHRKAIGRDPSRTWTLTEAFLVSMFWKSEGPGPRRPEFPSWSWAGWRAVYAAPSHGLLHLGLSFQSAVGFKLSVRVAEGLLDWEAMCRAKDWDLYEDISLLPHELYLQAPTVPLTVCRDPRSKLASWASGTAAHAADPETMKFCAIFQEADCDVLTEVSLVDAGVEQRIMDTGSISLKGILLRQRKEGMVEKPYYHDQVICCVLVVLEGQDGATRVGSLELRPENYFVRWKSNVQHRGAKEGHTWVAGQSKPYVECDECRQRAFRSIVDGRKEETIKLK
ncbi:Uu.00g050510.m01.CDS01 [Anthostomella pinea]|uniref:Uu.00g050510.m01.CDS01 n=1 Tax=Anthostomella pinea TaxID=933095 RepID=A0AAI8VTG6_9PEZI|nr:Uu.00g050510.m01.CDS01 [Anthostomella pinea]